MQWEWEFDLVEYRVTPSACFSFRRFPRFCAGPVFDVRFFDGASVLSRLAVVFLELFSRCRSGWRRWGVCWQFSLVHQVGANPNFGHESGSKKVKHSFFSHKRCEIAAVKPINLAMKNCDRQHFTRARKSKGEEIRVAYWVLPSAWVFCRCVRFWCAV